MALLRKYIIPCYLLVLLLHLAGILQSMEVLRYTTKLLLMLLLILWLLVSSVSLKQYFRPYLALLASLAGDALLIGSGTTFFLLGMIAFILAHVQYTFYFLQLQPVLRKRMGTMLLVFLLLLLVSGGLFFYLREALGSFQLPICMYMVIMCFMASLAGNTLQHPAFKGIGWRYFLPGALLFVVSDALLALNLFHLHVLWMECWVMLTYGMAQLLLTLGFKQVAITRK